MKKILVLLAVLPVLLNPAVSYGQSDVSDKKWYTAVGFTPPFTNVILGPPQLVSVDPAFVPPTYAVGRNGGMTMFTFLYDLRYNLVDFSDKSSLSLESPMGLGIYVMPGSNGDEGGGSVNIPLMLTWSIGNGASYKTLAENGFAAGIGLDGYAAPLFRKEKATYTKVVNGIFEQEYYDLKQFFALPAASLAYRRWSKRDRMMEYNVKMSLGKKLEQPEGTSSPLGMPQAFTFRFGILYYLNY